MSPWPFPPLRLLAATLLLLLTAAAPGCGVAVQEDVEPADATSSPIVAGAAAGSSPASSSYSAVAFGDLDGDGSLEIVAARAGAQPSAVLRWSGANVAIGQTLSGEATGVALGDLDGDFDLDVVLARGGAVAGALADEIWINDEGVLQLGITLTARDTRAVALADVDGDGLLDLALATSGAPDEILLGDGSGGFVASWATTGATDSSSVAFADVDVDGAPDVAFGRIGAADVIYENDGIGDFQAAWTSPDVASTFGLDWGDYDGDGRMDLARARGPAQGTDVRINAGSFDFSGAITHGAGPSDRAVAWSRMTRLQYLDLAVGDATGANRVDFVRSTGMLPASTTSETGDVTTDVAAGDLDGDGGIDLVSANDGQPLRVHAGGPNSVELAWSGTLAESGLGVDSGDRDGDGDLDVLVPGADGNTLARHPTRVYDSAGGTVTLAWSSPGSDGAWGAAWGDADGDGALDIAEGCIGGVPLRVYRNTGASFALGWEAPVTTQIHAVAWADVDGDGDLDLIAHTVLGSPLRVYENDGTGQFTLGWTSVETENGLALDVADWDGDGDLDFVAGAYAGFLRVYVNDGAGQFTVAWSSPSSGIWNTALWFDADGDGDVDLFAGDSGGTVTLYETQGGGFANTWSTSISAVRGSAAADWDGDGDTDVLVSRWNQPVAFLINDGEGVFSWPSTTAETLKAQAVATLDVDLDGDLDAFVVTSDSLVDSLFRMHRLGQSRLPNNPTRPAAVQPVGVPSVGRGTGVGQVLVGPTVPVRFLLVDEESDAAPSVALEYSTVGGGQWFPATTIGDTVGLASSPAGVAHVLDWDLAADGAEGDMLAVRLSVVSQAPQTIAHPIQHSALAEVSGWFRAYAACHPLDADRDGARCEVDCDDADPAAAPGAPEVPDDGVDQDCDGTDTVTCWVDGDLDGAGGSGVALDPDGSCTDDAGQSATSDDCDDADAEIHPGAPERCNGLDDDCDASVPANEQDTDNDGFLACAECDDGAAAIHPGAAELCDGLDGDCDGVVPTNEADGDSDGHLACADCDDASNVTFPGAPELCDGQDNTCAGALPADELDADSDGYLACAECDDAASTVHPGAPEACNGVDDDCDGSVPSSEVDADSDGYLACAECDDGAAAIHPGAAELCDGLDGDCDGLLPADEADGDGDGYLACAECDDASELTFPGAPERCDGQDNGCAGALPVDESDGDGDGVLACADCDDADSTVSPDATELCDGLDNDCDGAVPTSELDGDGDGHAPCAGDCADSEAALHPGAEEGCDFRDTDCDGALSPEELDGDGDGFSACLGDCSEGDASVYPGADEGCDGLDSDCDGALGAAEIDGDLDGFTDCAGDCLDTREDVHPGAPERCDALDQDCDGDLVEGWADADGDGLPECSGGEDRPLEPAPGVGCGGGQGLASSVLALLVLAGWPRRRRGWSPGVLGLALLALSPRLAAAEDAIDVAVAAEEAHQEHCAGVAAGRSDSATAAQQALVTEAWRQVIAAYEQSGASYLLYWRGVLSQCLNSEERAAHDLAVFARLEQGNRDYAAMSRDARRRLRQLGREDTAPPAEEVDAAAARRGAGSALPGAVARRVASPHREPGRVLVAVTGGYQRVGGWNEAGVTAGGSVGLVGPLRLEAGVAAFWSLSRQVPEGVFPSERVLLLSPSLGLGIELRGPVRPRLGLAFHAAPNPMRVAGPSILAGVLAHVGVDLPLGNPVAALRFAVEGGNLGPNGLLRALGGIVVGFGK